MIKQFLSGMYQPQSGVTDNQRTIFQYSIKARSGETYMAWVGQGMGNTATKEKVAWSSDAVHELLEESVSEVWDDWFLALRRRGWGIVLSDGVRISFYFLIDEVTPALDLTESSSLKRKERMHRKSCHSMNYTVHGSNAKTNLSS